MSVTHGNGAWAAFATLRQRFAVENRSLFLTTDAMTASEQKPVRRWYHITPDRVVLGVLALEGLLLLGEHLGWWRFYQPKGWTVVISLLAIGVAMLFLLLPVLARILFGWRFQLSIRSLLLLVVAIAAMCSWSMMEMGKVPRQREAATAIHKASGIIAYDYEVDASWKPLPGAAPHGPGWLRKLLGDDAFQGVIGVGFNEDRPANAGLEHLGELTQLQRLVLWNQVTDAGLQYVEGLSQLRALRAEHAAGVTDAGLKHLRGLTHLQELYLDGAHVSDAGMEHLKGLTELATLHLSDGNIDVLPPKNLLVTDEGMKYLTRLNQLQRLELAGAKITDAGLKHLQELRKLETLDLGITGITDVGLQALRGLPQLRELNLQHTRITDEGLKTIAGMTRLRSLTLLGTRITDAGLVHLRGMTQLSELWLDPEVVNNRISDEGVKRLQETLPRTTTKR